jgi:hypothetical protein
MQACAADAPRWNGIYRPISNVCAGQVLTINTTTFTYGDCKNTRMKILSEGEREVSFEVNGEAKCLLAGWILSLTPSGTDVNVRLYRSMKDKISNIPAIECTYARQPGVSQRKSPNGK